MPIPIKLVSNVKINGAHFEPDIVQMLYCARDTAPKFTDGTLWITSGNDGKHMADSKHYDNAAWDLRIKNIKGDVAKEAAAWGVRLRVALNQYKARAYDVVVESDHIHVEKDPK